LTFLAASACSIELSSPTIVFHLLSIHYRVIDLSLIHLFEFLTLLMMSMPPFPWSKGNFAFNSLCIS
jgi:hypothetical protein